jgi:hypothetical protein
MGLRNSPAEFMAAPYDIFRGELSGNMAIYMDDSIIFHSSFSEHISFLRTVFEKQCKAKLRINPKKSAFTRNSLVFLGFLFTPEGLKVDPKRFEKIRNLKPATNVKEIKMLLGFFQYFRKFLRGFSIISHPSRKLLQKATPFE